MTPAPKARERRAADEPDATETKNDGITGTGTGDTTIATVTGIDTEDDDATAVDAACKP